MSTKSSTFIPFIFSVERKQVLLFAFIVMMILTVPYIFGYANEGESWRYSGFVFGVEDGNSYIAKMLRGSEGDWLFRTPYTAEKQKGVFAYFSYLLLGKLASNPGRHEQLVVLFHFYRIAAGILAIMAMYDFISFFIESKRLRWTGLFFSCFGGGLGYILLMVGKNWWLGNLPLEFYSPESFGFLTLLGLPHLAIARAFLLYGVLFYLRMDIAKGGIIAGILWLVMGIFQPLTIVQALAITAGHLLFILGYQIWHRCIIGENDWSHVRDWSQRAIWAGCIPLPLVLYTYIAFSLDPVVSRWTAQNLIPSPHPLHYFVAYGLMLPFSIAGLVIFLRSGEPKKLFMSIWFFLFPFLVYVPYNLQRRLAEGFLIVLIILFVTTMEHAGNRMRRLGLSLLILTLPSTVILFFGSLSAATHPAIPLFRPADEVAAFQYLAENVDKDSVLLCSYETGNAIPAWAPIFVLVGHGPESADIAVLEPKVESFYQTTSPGFDRKSLIKEFDVRYVFWGPFERDLGDWNPDTEKTLEPFYSRNSYEVYRVMEEND